MSMEYSLGIYKYKSRMGDNQLPKLPEQLKMSQISSCGVLLELIMGKMKIYSSQGKCLYIQKKNYTTLPISLQNRHTYHQFSAVLDTDILDEACCQICNKFLIYERANNFVYEHILNELSQYFIISKISPCEGFVHLYRVLEFMSYSFPLIYASKSRDYRGTYNELKKALGGDGAGELKFFQKFLKELFLHDISYEYIYEVYTDSDNIDDLKREFSEFFKTDFFEFEENTLSFKFKDVPTIFIEIRNRYFHMLLGQGKNNFLSLEYDKNDLFRSLNPIFCNWLSVIFTKIIQHGLSASNI